MVRMSTRREAIDSIPLERLKGILKNSGSLSDVFRALGIRVHTDSYRYLYERVSREGLDIKVLRENKKRCRRGTLKTDEVLCRGERTYAGNTLKRILRETSNKGDSCEECGQGGKWKGKPLTLHLDHMNGERKDNRVENLRFLCPNCHSQTATYAGRNQSLGERHKLFCLICGEEKKSHSGKWCIKCYLEQSKGKPKLGARKVKCRPSVSILLESVEAEGYEGTGRRYGVSGNAIKKWLRAEGIIPPRKQKIKAP